MPITSNFLIYWVQITRDFTKQNFFFYARLRLMIFVQALLHIIELLLTVIVMSFKRNMHCGGIVGG